MTAITQPENELVGEVDWVQDEKECFRWGVEGLQSYSDILSDNIADELEEGVIPAILNMRDGELAWIFDRLAGISNRVYEDYVLTGDCLHG